MEQPMDTPTEERGFRQIGALLPSLPTSPDHAGSSQPTPPPRSPTTGTPERALVAPSSTGQLPSAIGAGALAAIEEARQTGDSDRLESALYRSLKPYSRSLRPIVNDGFDLIGYELVGPMDRASLATLGALADKMTAPAGRETVARAVGRCLQLTKSREPDAMDLRLMIEAFCDELAEFPADVVDTACRKWLRAEKWWPSLSELRDRCQRATRWRSSLRQALAVPR
jgi:hypothetical protein